MPKRKAAQQAVAAPPAPDYGKMTVVELKKVLVEKKLLTTGKKADLVERLENFGSAATSAPTASVEPPAKKAKKGATKKATKQEPEPEAASATSKAVASLKSVTDGAAKKKKKRSPKVDSRVWGSGHSVVDDYACMLNQTNVGHNNNKYYVIQLLKTPYQKYTVFTRWGRVGETGDQKYLGYYGAVDDAAKEFGKKFTAKTGNKWANREAFVSKPGKYTLLEMEDDSDDDQAGRLASLDGTDGPIAVKKTASCKLEDSTQKFVKFIFDEDMFREAMKGLEIDTKKLPLGKLSKTQVLQGFEVLEKIEKKLNGEKTKDTLQDLASQFYTRIPHDFGRQRPPVISSKEVLQKKMDMLMVLADIEMAQTMQAKEKKTEEVGEVAHPLDEKYGQLKTKLTVVKKTDPTFSVLKTYLDQTQGHRKLEIQDIFEVDREGEGDRFADHDSLGNRRLLWHGTNVAVVAAILKTGLRIMPHSGGRVGKGMYFASENAKSANYVRCAHNTGIMFLVEVALGAEHHISHDNWTLTEPPSGKDCIIAKGHTEPDPSKETELTFGGKKVTVPQGAPLRQPAWSGSSFTQSEYLVYKESQARIRYLLKLKF